MTEDQIKLAANSIAGLADATGQSFGDILDCLAYESYFLTDRKAGHFELSCKYLINKLNV